MPCIVPEIFTTAKNCNKKVWLLLKGCVLLSISGRMRLVMVSVCIPPPVRACVTDKGYYTNSFHLDVEKKVNPYDKVDFEQVYPAHASGGFICYGEYPNMTNNLKALENAWDYTYDKVPYYGTNTPNDSCYSCGYEGEFEATSRGFQCPQCKNRDSDKMSVTRRVCGYLGQPNSRPFIRGKQEEVVRRVKHL